MSNISIRDTVDTAVVIAPRCSSHTACAAQAAGGMVLDRLSVVNATVGMGATWLLEPPSTNIDDCDDSDGSNGTAGSGLGVLLIQDAAFVGPGQVGAEIDLDMSSTLLSKVTFTGFVNELNGSCMGQCRCDQPSSSFTSLQLQKRTGLGPLCVLECSR